MLKLDEGSVLQQWPHVCSVCSSQPTKGEFAIDTEVDYTDPMARQLRARKYVCQKCAEEIAALVPNKTLDKAKAEVKTWKAKYGELVAALDTLTKSVLNVSD